MALSEQEINFNYTQAINKANELSAVTGDLDKAIEDLDAATTFIRNNWDSNNSKTFLAKCIKERQKIADTKQDIIKASNTIKSMAETVKTAELNALAIARAEAAARAAAAAAASARTSAASSGAGTLAAAGALAVSSSSPQPKNTFSQNTAVQPKNTRQPSSIPTSVLSAMTKSASNGKASKSKR